ncbi:MAG: hypothetical protein ACI9TA_002793, partial [Reinekea sp.]
RGREEATWHALKIYEQTISSASWSRVPILHQVKKQER